MKTLFTFAKLVERLTKGFVKYMGRQPDNLEKLKIKQEAFQKLQQQEQKVIPFKYKKSFLDEVTEMEKKGELPKSAEEIMDKGDWDPSGFSLGGKVLSLGRKGLKKITTKSKKKSRLLTDDEIEDFSETLGDPETWLSEGTLEEAQQALKRQKEYEAYMYGQYKTGKLDPKPGEVNRSRLNYLRDKIQEMEMSGDKRLVSADEVDEYQMLEKKFRKEDLENKVQQLERKITDDEIMELKDLTESGYANGGRANFEIGGITNIIGSDLNEEEDLALSIGAGKATSGIINAARKYGPSIASFIFSGGLTGPAEAARAAAKQVAASKVSDALSERVLENITQQMARENQSSGTGGYQSSWGGVSDFMSGSGTAADMGSFKSGGLASMFRRK